VYNTGIGVAEEERTKIFDRFYRVDKARSRSGGNYGLGLAIAKAILEEHNAQIAVEGEYGKWVRFVMTFNA
jgi:signal transduction histidine kinase